MNKKKGNAKLIALLLSLSVLVYAVQFLFFRTLSQTSFYLLQDLAFIPIQIIVIYFVLEKALESIEKKEKLRKINVVIDSFFIETGTTTIRFLSKFDKTLSLTKEHLQISGTWTSKDFKNAITSINSMDFNMDSKSHSLYEIKEFLKENRLFMLSMFQNPNLLEHDSFTDMLWAVFHLMDELISREALENLPEADFNHLSLDIKRAYTALIIQWIHYSKHLKSEYPYLFSLAQRKQPFDENASVMITH